MLEFNDTYLKIDLGALQHNYKFIKSLLKPETKILAVIKAFAYGHEDVAIAKKLENEGVNYFAVAYVKEGIRLRNNGITTPILVLHPQKNDAAACVQYQLEPNIYSFKILEIFHDFLTNRSIEGFQIHLKFNTGLNRLGFKFDDIENLINFIKQNKVLKIQSVFSHLVASEDKGEKAFTLDQIEQYKAITNKIDGLLNYQYIKHLSNTSGALNYPEAHFDMIRTGIGLYGYGNDIEWTNKLKNVGSLYTIITQIHTLQVGESVGYNRGFIAKKQTKTATIPLGHADGLPRTWGNGKGFVGINGKKAPILGNVCMDMSMVDVTHIDCLEGDEVIVFDNQQTLEEIARNVGTISYELLTAISQRVERIIIN